MYMYTITRLRLHENFYIYSFCVNTVLQPKEFNKQNQTKNYRRLLYLPTVPSFLSPPIKIPLIFSRCRIKLNSTQYKNYSMLFLLLVVS